MLALVPQKSLSGLGSVCVRVCKYVTSPDRIQTREKIENQTIICYEDYDQNIIIAFIDTYILLYDY